ncbi:rifin PIR protein,putative [Plasmodium sp. DRC-Itaito]|nr:rifin PIR protein,putative [Plasmodium sp. DRC-Itaito]
MKVHYINILLFAHTLNILLTSSLKVNTPKKNPCITHHTHTNRSLCECDLYMPNYDNDPQMKDVIENFNKQTHQRFHEYDERMVEKRKQCKEQCDKEIQKIILKDKLEKELMEKFATLDTDIQSDAIPSCVCEKSLADKVEKGCLRCGGVLGGGVAPGVGVFGAVTIGASINAATASAIELAAQEGIKAGVNAVIAKIKEIPLFSMLLQDVDWSKFITESYYSTVDGLVKAVTKAIDWCKNAGTSDAKIEQARAALPNAAKKFGEYIAAGEKAAEEKTAEMIPGYTTQEMAKVTNVSAIFSDPIIISAIVVVTIAVILLIIYLILRRRKKKKMKKKLQYIKLLEE